MRNNEDKLLEVAKKNFSFVAERGSLESLYSDEKDFFEVSIWSLKKALEDAYALGLEQGKEAK